jgi:hypothetical protein
MMLKSGEPLAAQLMTAHNIAYMMRLVRKMRKAILEGKYEEFVRSYIKKFFPDGYSEEVMKGETVLKDNRHDKVTQEDDKEENTKDEAAKEAAKGKDEQLFIPKWVVEALSAADIDITKGIE